MFKLFKIIHDLFHIIVMRIIFSPFFAIPIILSIYSHIVINISRLSYCFSLFLYSFLVFLLLLFAVFQYMRYLSI